MNIGTAHLRALSEGVHVWLGAGGDSNAGCIETPEGVIVVDAQQHSSLARRFRAAIEEKIKKPLRILVNTHYHLDHTAGNVVFSDVPILAHDETLARLEASLGVREGDTWPLNNAMTKIEMFFGGNIQQLVPADDPAWAWFQQRVAAPEYALMEVKPPALTFSEQFSFHSNNETIRLPYWGPAHCVGDVPIILEQAKVAFLGDLLFCGRFPWLGDCNLDGWISILDRILQLDLVAVVPGHGEPGTLAEVCSFRNLLVAIRSAVAGAIKSGWSEEAAVRDLKLAEYEHMSRYREWMGFNVRSAYRYLKSGREHGSPLASTARQWR